MFGKLKTEIQTKLPKEEVLECISDWAERNGLESLSAEGDAVLLYRFGSPKLSNPIMLKLNPTDGAIIVEGWVQTLIPFFRWKLIDVSGKSIATAVDYRRKGGYFIRDLREKVAARSAHGGADQSTASSGFEI